MCCSLMSHYLFYQYFYKHPACTVSLYYISDVLAIITKTITIFLNAPKPSFSSGGNTIHK